MSSTNFAIRRSSVQLAQDYIAYTTESPEHLANSSSRRGSVYSHVQSLPEASQPEDVLLETDLEKRSRKRSHYVIYVTVFLMSIGFSIVMTSAWPYLQKLDPNASKSYLGWVIASNPMGQMAASPIFGYFSNRLNCLRICFQLTLLLFMTGNIMYSLLALFGSWAKEMMIVSRIIIGISSANVALCRSYMSASTLMSERTTGQSLLAACSAMGFIIGPVIQTLLVTFYGDPITSSKIENKNSTELLQTIITLNAHNASEDDHDYEETLMLSQKSDSNIYWNMYTAAGWIVACLSLCNFVLFTPCIFNEHNIAFKEAEAEVAGTKESSVTLLKKDYAALFNILYSFFIILTIFVLLETLAVPMSIDMYAWENAHAMKVIGIGLGVLGILSALMFSIAGLIANKFSDRFAFLIFGLIPLAVGIAIHIPMGSTLPKIQNCTEIVFVPGKQYSSLAFQSEPSNYSLNENSSLNKQGLHRSSEFQFVPNSQALRNYTRRTKRHAFTDTTKQCTPGCPPEQKWCFYTPIIEIPQIIVAYILIVIGYSISFVISSALFSKLLGPANQGMWMGILTSCGSLSRMLGPIFVTYMYTNVGPRWTLVVVLIMLIFVIISNSILYKRLVPLRITSSDNNIKERF